MKMYCLLRFVFSVDLAFIKFATSVSARRRTLVPVLVSGPRTLAIYLFSLLGTVYI